MKFQDEIGYTEQDGKDITIDIDEEISYKELIKKVELTKEKYNLQDEDIVIRTWTCGCGNTTICFNTTEEILNKLEDYYEQARSI